MSIADASELDSTSSNPLTLPLAAAATCAALADWLFFGWPGNWRAWGFLTWRLERYFANTPPER